MSVADLQMIDLGKRLRSDQSVFQAFGIYAIRNGINGRIYIGHTAKSFIMRWRWHRSELRMGYHPRRDIQCDWAQYGDTAFYFSILEIVAAAGDLPAREERHILYWARTIGIEALYNSFFGLRAVRREFGIVTRLRK